MILIFLYGPPAVGKYTVGKTLARLTGYRLFHNHLTADVVEEIIDRDTPAFGRAVRKIRLDLIAIAAKSETPGLIFTHTYLHPKDIAEVRRYVATVRRAGGRVCFVKLTTSADVLERRVIRADRKRFGKISSRSTLRSVLGRHDFTTQIPGVTSLIIDTTSHDPKISAQMIQRAFHLPTNPQKSTHHAH